jgi:hypothetical protein
MCFMCKIYLPASCHPVPESGSLPGPEIDHFTVTGMFQPSADFAEGDELPCGVGQKQAGYMTRL